MKPRLLTSCIQVKWWVEWGLGWCPTLHHHLHYEALMFPVFSSFLLLYFHLSGALFILPLVKPLVSLFLHFMKIIHDALNCPHNSVFLERAHKHHVVILHLEAYRTNISMLYVLLNMYMFLLTLRLWCFTWKPGSNSGRVLKIPRWSYHFLCRHFSPLIVQQRFLLHSHPGQKREQKLVDAPKQHQVHQKILNFYYGLLLSCMSSSGCSLLFCIGLYLCDILCYAISVLHFQRLFVYPPSSACTFLLPHTTIYVLVSLSPYEAPWLGPAIGFLLLCELHNPV